MAILNDFRRELQTIYDRGIQMGDLVIVSNERFLRLIQMFDEEVGHQLDRKDVADKELVSRLKSVLHDDLDKRLPTFDKKPVLHSVDNQPKVSDLGDFENSNDDDTSNGVVDDESDYDGDTDSIPDDETDFEDNNNDFNHDDSNEDSDNDSHENDDEDTDSNVADSDVDSLPDSAVDTDSSVSDDDTNPDTNPDKDVAHDQDGENSEDTTDNENSNNRNDFNEPTTDDDLINNDVNGSGSMNDPMLGSSNDYLSTFDHIGDPTNTFNVRDQVTDDMSNALNSSGPGQQEVPASNTDTSNESVPESSGSSDSVESSEASSNNPASNSNDNDDGSKNRFDI